MSDIIYIGRVRWVHENYEKNYRYATVEPLVQSSEDQKRWIGSISDPVAEFPARGFVNWHDAPKGLEAKDIRQFEVENHPFYKGEPDKEAFQVRNHKYPTEILDLRDIGTERDIRILLTSKGVFLNDRPLVGRCVLWVQDEKWVGPVDLARRSGTSSWVLASEQRLDSIRCWKIPPEAIQQVELDGTRYLLAPNQDNLGQHLGLATWESDEVLAKRVLGRLLKRDRNTAEALKISKDVFKKYVETIEQAGLVGSMLAQELSFHERIKEILEVISSNVELLDEAASVCFAIGPVKEKMEEKAEEEYQRKLAEHEERLGEDLTKKRAELDAVVRILSEKQEELCAIESRINALEKDLSERVYGFQAELEARLRDLAEKPEHLFAEMAVIKAFMPRSGPSQVKPRPKVRTHIGKSDSDIQIVQEPSALMGALSTRLLSCGISPVVGQALHSALLAGLVPVLIGSEAHDVVSSYVDCVSGGVLNWIPVGGSMFEPSDILARFDSSSRCLVPNPGGLLDLLLDDSDALHVAVLDGFNRAAVDGYLIPLLKSAHDVARGRSPRSIPLAPPGFAPENDGYAGVCRVAWNRNVLLMLCPSSGASTLPVPKEFWAYCAVLDASDPAPSGVSPGLGTTPPTTRVSADIWKAWSDSARVKSETLEVLRSCPKEARTLPPSVLAKTESTYVSGTVLGLKHEIAFEQAIKISLLPYLVAAEEPVDLWFQYLGIALNETDRRIGDAIQRLGE